MLIESTENHIYLMEVHHTEPFDTPTRVFSRDRELVSDIMLDDLQATTIRSISYGVQKCADDRHTCV